MEIKAAKMHSLLFPYSTMYPQLSSLSLTRFLKEYFISPWADCREVIFGTKFTPPLHWEIAIKQRNLQFSYHYKQSSRCSKLPNEIFCNVISGICQRT